MSCTDLYGEGAFSTVYMTLYMFRTDRGVVGLIRTGSSRGGTLYIMYLLHSSIDVLVMSHVVISDSRGRKAGLELSESGH